MKSHTKMSCNLIFSCCNKSYKQISLSIAKFVETFLKIRRLTYYYLMGYAFLTTVRRVMIGHVPVSSNLVHGKLIFKVEEIIN